MPKKMVYRAIGDRGLIVPTPLYVDDALLAEIVLGENARYWKEVRTVFERQGMPAPKASVRGLYYAPAILKFLNRHEGISARSDDDFPEDGPENFGP